jgi:septal ring factor EnvC (AmiA/AmiB activator)
MRTGSSDIDRRIASGRSVLPLALLVLAALCAFAALAGGAPAESLREQFQRKQAQLSHNESARSDLSATIAEQNRQVDALIGEVAETRARAQAVAEELAAKQAELDRARAHLARERHRLEVVRARMRRALGVLRRELVSIYEAGEPDTLSVVLNAASWSEMIARSDYLDAYQHHFQTVVDRVRSLRDEIRKMVEQLRAARDRLQAARDAIAAQKREIDQTRATLEQRRADLVALRRARQHQLDALESRGQALADNLAAISDQIQAQAAASAAAPAVPAPLAPGDQAQLLANGDAAAPASAPEAVKAVIAAANQIDTTPYVWGGGHGSFSSSGYDCSGAVSYALNGGGFLSSPLDSTGLETWGVPGPGRWITVYANAGHAFAVIAGLRWDTSGDASGTGPRWHSDAASTAGFIARHPDGY